MTKHTITTNKPSKSQTERDIFEAGITAIFKGQLYPVENSHEIIAKFKDGTFAMSELGLMLYTNGYNLRGISNKYPNGLVYYDGKNLFGIGYFAKEKEKTGHLHIVAPQGNRSLETVLKFIDEVRKSGLAHNSVYVRYLSETERDMYLDSGFLSIETDPWHPDAPEEDETFPNRRFLLDDVFEKNADGEIRIKNLKGENQRGFKKKNRLGYQRFENFLQRNELTVSIIPYHYSLAEVKQAKEVVIRYFDAKKKLGGLVGSTPEDYFSLLLKKPNGVNGEDYFSYLCLLTTVDGKTAPIAFFSGERLQNKKVALYATITMRFPEYLEKFLKDDKGFTAIPQYIWLSIFKDMWKKGISEVDVGGSETIGLDDQKRQLGGNPEKTYWVVKK